MEVITLKKGAFTAEIVLDHDNQRTKLENYRGDFISAAKEAVQMASLHRHTKVIAKVKNGDLSAAREALFIQEGILHHYFGGSDAWLFSRFLSEERRQTLTWVEEDSILLSIKKKDKPAEVSESGITIRKSGQNDAEKLAALYRSIFTLYPVPLFDPEYIKESMKNGNIYFAAEKDGAVISAASAEINRTFANAEISDCATHPENRSQRLIYRIINMLEEELRTEGVYCTYSLARARSAGMNAVLLNSGYYYTGRLLNNCWILESLENMNIWCKNLAKTPF